MKKILTGNVRHGGGKRAKDIIEAISGYEADTIVLTECRCNQVGRASI